MGICVATLGCGDQQRCGEGAPKAVELAQWIRPANPDHHESLSEIVVHVDISSSMKGYVTAGSEFSRVLGGLDQIAAKLQPRHSISVKSVGHEVHELGGIEALRSLAGDRGAFDDEESRLVQALEGIADPMDSAGTLGIPRCHIFVTDGLQYSARRGLCDEGHDSSCLGERFRRLITDGWGMHVFAIRSRFSGVVDVPGRRGGVRLETGQRQASYRPFLLLILVDGDADEKAASLGHVVATLRKYLENTVSPSLVRELHLSAPLVRLSSFELHADEWRLKARRQDNPARVVPGPWEGPDGYLLPEWIHRVQVRYRRAKAANAHPFLLNLRMDLSLTPEGERALPGSALQQIAQGLRLVQLPPPEPPGADAAEQATDNEIDAEAEGSSEEESPRRRTCEPKKLHIHPISSELAEDFEPISTDGTQPTPEEPLPEVEAFARLSWSEFGDFPPSVVLKLAGPERFETTAAMPDWISDWSVDASTLEQASSEADRDHSAKSRLLDLDRILERLASEELVGRVLLEPQYIVLEPCLSPCEN